MYAKWVGSHPKDRSRDCDFELFHAGGRFIRADCEMTRSQMLALHHSEAKAQTRKSSRFDLYRQIRQLKFGHDVFSKLEKWVMWEAPIVIHTDLARKMKSGVSMVAKYLETKQYLNQFQVKA